MHSKVIKQNEILARPLFGHQSAQHSKTLNDIITSSATLIRSKSQNQCAINIELTHTPLVWLLKNIHIPVFSINAVFHRVMLLMKMNQKMNPQ